MPSIDWLLYSAIRKEALLTSQIEGTQATLVDLFDKEAGLVVSNTDDVEEVTNYLLLSSLICSHLYNDTGSQLRLGRAPSLPPPFPPPHCGSPPRDDW